MNTDIDKKLKERKSIQIWRWVTKIVCFVGLIFVIYLQYLDDEGILIFVKSSDINVRTVVYLSIQGLLFHISGSVDTVYTIYKYNMELKHLLVAKLLSVLELFILFIIFKIYDIWSVVLLSLSLIPSLYLYLVIITDKTGKYQEDFTGREHLLLPERKKAD